MTFPVLVKLEHVSFVWEEHAWVQLLNWYTQAKYNHPNKVCSEPSVSYLIPLV